MAIEFKLPELGENIESGDIVNLLIAEGDSVTKDQNILEIEAGKATMEIPSPLTGTVKKLHVKAGDSVAVGQLIMEVDAAGEEVSEPPATKEKPEEAPVQPKAPVAASEKPESVPEKSKSEPVETPGPVRAEPVASTDEAAESKQAVSAAPNVRRLARELGVDIHDVEPATAGGRISLEDVKTYAREVVQHGGGKKGGDLGEVRVEKMSAIRKATMAHMAHCWATIPHVTQHDTADITKLEMLRKQYAPRAEAAGAKLTTTAIIIKVIASALKMFPKFNCSIDPEKAEILYKQFYNIGIAMDTPKGLLVPVIRDGDKKNIVELALELKALSEKAREGKLALSDLQGGTFTLTNLGIIGGSFFTPIVNAPEVAILGTGRAYWQSSVECDGKRFKLPLSLSYDHRIIDGADGARFLRWVVEAIEEPMLLSLEG
jgi:pyruvate dehydrogenase E2 component (dihydrolipoamide acetyltransferase)